MLHLESEVVGVWLPDSQPVSIQVLVFAALSRHRGVALVHRLQD